MTDRCNEPHPDDLSARCINSADKSHADHYGRNALGVPMDWPNQDYRSPPRLMDAKDKRNALWDLQRRTREERRQNPVDAMRVYVGPNATHTTLRAATKALPRSGVKRRAIYDYLKAQWAVGALDHEMEVIFTNLWGTKAGRHESISGARSGLRRDLWVMDSGLKRLIPGSTDAEAIAWIVVEALPDVLKANPHLTFEYILEINPLLDPRIERSA